MTAKLDGTRQAAVLDPSVPEATRKLCENQKDFYQEINLQCPGTRSASSMITDVNTAKKVVIYGNIDVPNRPNCPPIEDGTLAHERPEWKNYSWTWLGTENKIRKDFKSKLFTCTPPSVVFTCPPTFPCTGEFIALVVEHGSSKSEVKAFAESVIREHKEKQAALAAAEQEAALAAQNEAAAYEKTNPGEGEAESEEEEGVGGMYLNTASQYDDDEFDDVEEPKDKTVTVATTANTTSAAAMNDTAESAMNTSTESDMDIPLVEFVIYNSIKEVCYHYMTTETVAIEVENWADTQPQLKVVRVTGQTEEGDTTPFRWVWTWNSPIAFVIPGSTSR